jgi:formylglycine-generating enzyme required for sulfatase activity
MVQIPAGGYERGDLHGTGQPDERPVRTVSFTKAFEIGKYEVTFDEYDLFAAATGRQKPNEQWGEGYRGDHPVINVSWDDAVAYADWLSEKTGSRYRLPSEAEWEYAARAETRTVRYWPESADGEADAACAYANVFDKKNEARIRNSYNTSWGVFECEDDYPFSAPVGQFLPNGWQLHDMLGNVWEWVEDCYHDSYDGAPTDGSSRETADGGKCDRRVLRGGSWNNKPKRVRSGNRNNNRPDNRNNNVGFRLASPPARARNGDVHGCRQRGGGCPYRFSLPRKEGSAK